jgi:hypothetical protein
MKPLPLATGWPPPARIAGISPGDARGPIAGPGAGAPSGGGFP